MAPSRTRAYVRGVSLTRRLLVYPDRVEVQASHPVYYSWSTVARFAPEETYRATKYAQKCNPWPKRSA